MDLLEVYNKFATACVNALNEKGVKPLDGDSCHVLIVVGDPKVLNQPPYAGSLNYVNDKWQIDHQISEGTPC